MTAEKPIQMRRYRPPGPNPTAFGSKLRLFCRKQLDHVVPTYDHGFQDGGCLTLAVALKDWSAEQLELRSLYVIGLPRRPQHIVAWSAGACLDSDGAYPEHSLITKFDYLERQRHRLGTFRVDQPHNIPFYPELRDRLVRGLTRRFGPFTPDMLTGVTARQPETGRFEITSGIAPFEGRRPPSKGAKYDGACYSPAAG